MITAAAVVPQPPILLPGATGRPVPEVEELRAAASGAVRWVVERAPDALVLIGCADEAGFWGATATSPVASFAPGANRDPGRLPPSLAVATSLLPVTGLPVARHAVAVDADPTTATELGSRLASGATSIGLVVAADGSARRGEKAPGHFDQRAAVFDAGVGHSLRAGDVAGLLALDTDLATELLASGRAALQVLAGAFAGHAVTSHLDYEGDPFGVWYAVARWARTGR